ncbi:DUF6903 family protein [Anaerococcus provencensis]|uniref:DUF6903 family protein n=1 Tax=Anaerococcus provencensis TaxID=938293 RepID=UPI00031AD4D8|nr:hypothetical protein [Anaerococcus provencensis]
MDYYKKEKINNCILFVIFVVGIILQFVGHSRVGYPALGLQFISLFMLLLVLFIYNKSHQ